MNLNKNKFLNRTNLLLLGLVCTIMSGYAFISSDEDRSFAITKNLDLFEKLYREVHKSYVDEVEPAKLMRAGLDSMLKSLDPYTNYISEGQIEGYRMKQGGAAANIGVQLIKKGEEIIISEVEENAGADKAGLQAGDILFAIDGANTEGKTVEDVNQVLIGQPSSEIQINYKKPNSSTIKTVTVIRQKEVPTSIPHFEMVDKNTAYIKLKTFIKRDCTKELLGTLKKLQEENDVKQLIIDLRFNGGGLLAEAIKMVNLFVDANNLVVSTKGKVPDWDKEYKTQASSVEPDLPLIVLVNGRSASASEIFAGCMQDYDRGIVIGQRTFGKGLVQQTKDIGYNSKLKLTVAKYYLPSGRCVQAIDYSGRYKDGGAIKVPDSLRTVFKTQNGRKVFDGGGVDPDIEVKSEVFSNISYTLQKNHLLFDFATQYKINNPEITKANEFEISDALYNEFVTYLQGKDYEYTTKSEKILEQLKEKAEEEQYKSAIENTLQQLNTKIQTAKDKDLYAFKDEVKRLLKYEIISRYYYEKGKVEASLGEDPVILKALELFKDKKQYKTLLETVKK